MGYESVDVYVKDDTGLAAPVEGMLVRVYDSTNTTFYTQDTTDADGHVGFTLWAQSYNLRFYKSGTQTPQPQAMVVVDAGVNSFDVSSTVFVHPLAVDPRLCRCSGHFRDITGAPRAYLDMQFIAAFAPILLEGDAVLSERRSIRTDTAGYACIDLIRGACYLVTVEGLEDEQRQVSVPDSGSANLPDLLFPVVEEVSFDVDGPHSLAVGATLELTPVVTTSAGVVLEGTARADVLWSSSDDSVLSVAPESETLTLRGIAAGSANLVATRRNQSIIRIPSSDIQGVPQAVTVT
jgi:hypothetical protein